MKLLFNSMYAKSPFFIKPVVGLLSGQVNKSYLDPIVSGAFDIIDDTLKKDGGRQWLAGGSEPTGADFMASPAKSSMFSVMLKPG